MSAGVFSAWCLVAADACVRSGWLYISIARHAAAALALYGAVGALLGLVSTCLVWFEWRAIGRRLAASRPWLRCAFYGVVAGLASLSTAIATFSGEHVARTAAATFGPIAFVLIAGGVAAVGSWLLIWALRSLSSLPERRHFGASSFRSG